MNGRTPQQLQDLLDKHFNMSELRQLAFSLGIDHENLEGNTKRDFILSLISHAQRHALLNELDTLVEKETSGQRQLTRKSFWGRLNFGTKVTIVSIIVTIIGTVVTLVGFFPETLGITPHATPTLANRILLQVQVNSVEDLSDVANAKVTLNVAEQIFAPQRTDSNGRAVFDLPSNIAGTLVGITVETSSQVETQNISVDFGMRAVEFQIRP